MVLIILSTLPIFSYADEGKQLYMKYNCSGCHSPYERRTGPSFKEISQRYGTSQKAIEKVAKLIIKPNPSNWPGFAYMPPYNIPYEEALKLAEYVLIHSQKEKKKEKNLNSLPSSEFF
ncbi:MAG: c-type cytochrome [Hydrogenothermaceae bacterium]|nr:c-type cytochrome [Hydrogenothermaceae bacterium]